MGEIIIRLIGEFVEITGNADVDGVLVSFIGFIALSVAFDLVGKLFDAIGFYDSNLMSDVHWTIRMIVFCGLTYALVKFVKFVTWIFSFQWWVYVIAFIVVVLVVLGVYYVRYRFQKKKNCQTQLIEKEIAETKSVEEENSEIHTEKEETMKAVIVYNKCRCPRCNSKLVKRHGPYGDFYGCDAYGRTGCRYTRKYL